MEKHVFIFRFMLINSYDKIKVGKHTLNIMKVIYQKPITNITLNTEEWKAYKIDKYSHNHQIHMALPEVT